jgi:hypothetical protein
MTKLFMSFLSPYILYSKKFFTYSKKFGGYFAVQNKLLDQAIEVFKLHDLFPQKIGS